MRVPYLRCFVGGKKGRNDPRKGEEIPFDTFYEKVHYLAVEIGGRGRNHKRGIKVK